MSTNAAPSPVICAAVVDNFSSQAVAIKGAKPSSKAGNRIEKVTANRSFGRLISASKLPAMASNDRCFGLETSSSTSPSRGSISGGSAAGAIALYRVPPSGDSRTDFRSNA